MAVTVEKLQSKGIIAFETQGVLARLTKYQSQNREFGLQLVPSLQAIAVTAAHMRDRVITRGLLADGPAAEPSERRGWHREDGKAVPGQVVSLAYAAKAGTNQTTFASSADLHRLARTPSIGYVTGGMWAGLTARASGKSYDQAEFRIGFDGSSEGHGGAASPRPGAPTVGADGGKAVPQYVRDRQTVRNSAKAWIVFVKNGSSHIEPTDLENYALCDGLMRHGQLAVFSAFAADPLAVVPEPDNYRGDSALRIKLLRAWKV